MENRKISFLVRNLLSIINLAKILTNNERFRKFKKRWLWWLKWHKKLTMNLAKKWCMTELFFVRLLQMYLFSVAMLPCTFNTGSHWMMKKNKLKIFFFDILCFRINYCLLQFVSIINLFLWELLPESSFVS